MLYNVDCYYNDFIRIFPMYVCKHAMKKSVEFRTDSGYLLAFVVCPWFIPLFFRKDIVSPELHLKTFFGWTVFVIGIAHTFCCIVQEFYVRIPVDAPNAEPMQE